MAADKMPNSDNTDKILAGVAGDLVKWAAKGNKVVMGNIMDLKPDSVLNVRFREGCEVYGVKLKKDSYDIPGMRQQLIDGFGVREAITVSVRKDGTMVPLRGNRRTIAGQELVNDPTTPEPLRKQLVTQTPMLLLTGLTDAQERELVNDQTTKDFLHSEVVRYIFSLRRQHWSYERIALLLWETMGKFSGSKKKVAEIREIADPGLKREKIKSWLRGTLDCYLIWGYDLGQFTQKQILLTEMAMDGLITEEMEKPYVKSLNQKRIAELKKAKELDGTKWNGMVLMDGSEFKKVYDKFHQEDYNPTQIVKGDGKPKMLDRATVEGLAEVFTSKVARQLIQRVLGNEQPELPLHDEFAGICETKMQLLETSLPRLKPEVAAIVRICLVNPDAGDFQRFLAANQVETAPIAPDTNEQPATEPTGDENDEFKLG
jgi:hypothetical protein